MVISSPTLFARARGADKYWRRRRIMSLSQHYYGRKQNCFSIAIKYVNRALRYSTLHRQIKKREDKQLWNTRLEAASTELGTNWNSVKNTIDETGIALDRKSLQNLAIWEPRSFRGLASLAKAAETDGLNSLDALPHSRVITRSML
ncbi:unnamed protein product [Meganyctiphanes norvegica]|uniref:Ribosomal protein L20 n=1 Tax=Meganyctiphanes norvegica TaxID=48144 RepID=A0AAV2RWW0_MEGNR